MRIKMQALTFLIGAALVASTAFAKKFPLTADPSVPAARGEVNIGKDKNGNTKVDLQVKFLAPPENLTPPKTAYLVWFQDRGGEPTMEGQLRLDKKLNGNFKTTTPLRNFDLFVTAETDASAKTPGSPQLLRTSVQP
jgi:hypothetical protein